MNEEREIDLKSVFHDIWENILLIVLISFLAGLIGHAVIKFVHKPKYVSNFSYVVMSNESSLINSKDGQSKIAKVFKEVIESTVLYNSVKDSLGYGEKDNLSALISAEIVQTVNINNASENSNIIKVSVTDSNPVDAYIVAKAVVKNCPEASDYINKNAILTLLEKPNIPTSEKNPVKYKLVDMLVFVVSFLALCVLSAYTSSKRDSIRNADEIKKKLNCTLLASVPDVTIKNRKSKRNEHNDLLITDRHTGFYYIENIKKIRNKIELEKSSGGMCVAVSSILGGEGRTTIAVNLALSLAMHSGNRVLLVDLDFKKPDVIRLLNYNGEVNNISDFLRGRVTLDEAMVSCEHMNVMFQKLPYINSSELIESDNMKIILEYMKIQYDYIIIDTSPISKAADMETLSSLVDSTVLVVKQDTATSASLNEAVDMFERNKCKLIGCIYNKDSQIARESGYGYSSDYYGRYDDYEKNPRNIIRKRK